MKGGTLVGATVVLGLLLLQVIQLRFLSLTVNQKFVLTFLSRYLKLMLIFKINLYWFGY